MPSSSLSVSTDETGLSTIQESPSASLENGSLTTSSASGVSDAQPYPNDSLQQRRPSSSHSPPIGESPLQEARKLSTASISPTLESERRVSTSAEIQPPLASDNFSSSGSALPTDPHQPYNTVPPPSTLASRKSSFAEGSASFKGNSCSSLSIDRRLHLLLHSLDASDSASQSLRTTDTTSERVADAHDKSKDDTEQTLSEEFEVSFELQSDRPSSSSYEGVHVPQEARTQVQLEPDKNILSERDHGSALKLESTPVETGAGEEITASLRAQHPEDHASAAQLPQDASKPSKRPSTSSDSKALETITDPAASQQLATDVHDEDQDPALVAARQSSYQP